VLSTNVLRVQCKWAALQRGVVEIRLGRCRHSPTQGYIRNSYCADEIDAIAAYCDDFNECFLIPVDLVDGQDWLSLRVDPPRKARERRYTLPLTIPFLGP
jgi:hypothetical protein